jgi:hypothetical protein
VAVPLEEKTADLAAEAFVYGYPLVLMDRTLSGAEQNQLQHLRAFPDASFRDVVSPNADTLYSIASIDLSAGPVILRLPPSEGRYHVMQLLSAWTDVFAAPGSRTTGDDGGAFAIVGPRHDGPIPEGTTELRSPTILAWLIGRTQTNGASDYENVHRFQDGISLEGPAVPARASGGAAPPPAQVAAMDGATFLSRLAALLVDNPPAPDDAPLLERLATIGLRPGRFTPEPGAAAALDEGVRSALERVRAAGARLGDPVDGWMTSRGTGVYGTDYLRRAAVALFGLGANLSEDALYPHTETDATGAPLHGANRYRLRFARGQTPPARAFWSLTLYDEHHYFADNPIDRYAIGDRDALAYSEDGSLELWLQHDRPEGERAANWLPAPDGPFSLMLRIYWPEQDAVDGTWTPPPVEKVG